MSKAKLKEGVILRPFGPNTSITNENLTDEIARHLLSAGRASEEDFEVLPGEEGSNDSNMTVAQIKEILTKNEIPFDPKANKAALLALFAEVKPEDNPGGE